MKSSYPLFQFRLLRYVFLIAALLFILIGESISQIDNDGCVQANFGVDAGVFSNQFEFGNFSTSGVGSNDWFVGSGGSGIGVVDESNFSAIQTLLQGGGNPIYEERMKYELSSLVNGQVMIDAVFGRDYFGGSGYTDQTAFISSNKNGNDLANWNLGSTNVLGKNDIIDHGGFMVRDGNTLYDDLWFFGLMNTADPGGSAYYDFEFLAEVVTINPSTNSFTSSGPDLGHTAFEFDNSGNIITVGDFIFNVSLENGGADAQVEMRIWTSRSDFQNVNPVNFTWGPDFDGPFNGSSYGYASIIPLSSIDACGIVNGAGEIPAAPPWGTKNTSSNSYQTSYPSEGVFEVGVNMTAFGIDHSSLLGADPCAFPINTFIVKTRTSGSFTSELKDFAGPYSWATPSSEIDIQGNAEISCLNPFVTMSALPDRDDADYLWTTVNGNIVSDPTNAVIQVDKEGIYELEVTLLVGCELQTVSVDIPLDFTLPFMDTPTSVNTVSCNGNDGTIDLTVTGGTPPFNYNWSNGQSTQDINGLSSGIYSVTITDSNGCSKEYSTEVFDKVPTTINSTVSNVVCFGENNGSIDITAVGNDPLSYNWSNGEQSEDLNNIVEGSYSITVTDADGCTETTTMLVAEPTLLETNIVSVTDETDSTLDDGTIDLNVSGGTSPYTYDWSNDGPEEPDNDSQDLTNLPAGIYTVTVTDTNGCTSTNIAIVYEPEICFDGIDNDNDGLIDCFDNDCVPPSVGPITGPPAPPCVGDSNVSYSITPNGADSYTWSVPEGANITAGQGTASILVDWVTNIGGEICVQAIIDGCYSEETCLLVSPNDVPTILNPIILNNGN